MSIVSRMVAFVGDQPAPVALVALHYGLAIPLSLLPSARSKRRNAYKNSSSPKERMPKSWRWRIPTASNLSNRPFATFPLRVCSI
jgi:hypothetical protein